MRKSKWFVFYGNYLKSRRRARTKAQAWEKTLEKWKLILKGKIPMGAISTCGLCDLYNGSTGCFKCPVRRVSYYDFCYNTPYRAYASKSTITNAKLELVFLKRVRQLTERKSRNRN